MAFLLDDGDLRRSDGSDINHIRSRASFKMAHRKRQELTVTSGQGESQVDALVGAGFGIA
ncbi:MAG: hypothetical protein IKE42_27655 [Aquamicrobium sp.]|nr:hypothetical protein [Aquamicrobium sp.]